MCRTLFIVLIVVFWCHPDFSQVAVHLLHKSTQGDHHNFIHLNDVFYLTPYFFLFSLFSEDNSSYLCGPTIVSLHYPSFVHFQIYILLARFFCFCFWKLVLWHFCSEIDFLHFFTHMFFSKILLFPHFLHFYLPLFPFLATVVFFLHTLDSYLPLVQSQL